MASTLQWDHGLVRSIRVDRERERAAAPNLAATLGRVLDRFSKMYGERIHYALELIQNAEDANATSMLFRFEPKRLIVWNDGDPFSRRDVKDISDAALSHKRNKIGFFGVGFKAVFTVTDRPQIVSGKFNFELTDFIYPRERAELGFADELYSPNRGSTFVLPYDANKVASVDELVEAVRELDARLLLFLRHIRSVRFETIKDSGSETWTVARTGQNPTILTNTATQETTKWRVFRSSMKIPDGLEVPESKLGITRTYPVVAFPEAGTETRSVRSAPLFCYLPTRRTTGLPFLVNADFVPTSGRNDIERSDWNDWLLRQLGKLAGRSAASLADSPASAVGLFDFVPLKEDVADDQIQPIVVEMHEVLKRARIVPSRSDGLVLPLSTVLGTPKLATLLTRRDLTRLIRRAADFPDTRLRERDLDVIRQLGARQVGTEQLLRIAAEKQSAKRGATWYLHLYDFLADTFEDDIRKGIAWSSDETKVLWSKVTNTRILLLRDGRLASPSSFRKGRMVCYAQREVRAEELESLFEDRRIVFLHNDLQEASVLRRKPEPQEVARMKGRVKAFLKLAFGVVVYLQVSNVVDRVLLPIFGSGEISDYSRNEILAFTDFIRRNLARYAQLYRKSHYSLEGVYSDLRKSLRVAGYSRVNGGVKTVVVPCWSAYLGAPYVRDLRLRRLFAPYGAPFVSTAYLRAYPTTPKNVLNWKDFLLEMGVWDTLALHPLDPYKLSWDVAKERFGSQVSSTRDYVVRGDFESPDFDRLLSVDETSGRRFEILCELWKVLETSWGRHRRYLECTLEYFYRTALHTQGPTKFATQIRSLAWVPTLDGKIAAPGDLLQNSEENRLLLGRSGRYARFGGKKQFLEDIGVQLEPSRDSVVQELRRLRSDPSTRGKSFRPRMSAIYSFISRHLPEDPEAAEKLRRTFGSDSLVYLPRKDKQWWAPSELLWEDSRDIFGAFRGYASLYYGEACRPLAQFLRIPDTPRIPEFVKVLEDFSRKRNFGKRWLREVQGQLRFIYLHLERLLNATVDESSSQALESFLVEGRLLSEGDRFEPVATLCFVDDHRLHALFRDAVKVAYVPFNPSSIPRTLEHLGVLSLTSRVTRSTQARHPRPLETIAIQRFREALDAALRFISQNYPSVLMGQEIEMRNRIRQLHADRVYSIAVRSELHDATGAVLAKRRQRVSAFLDDRKWRLLITEDAREPELAQELSMLYGGANTHAYPVLLRLLEAIHDEDEFQSRIHDYGVEPVADERVMTPMEVLSEASEVEMGVDPTAASPTPVSGEGESEAASSPPSGGSSEVLESSTRRDELVDLNGLTSFAVVEVSPETTPPSPTKVVRVTGRQRTRSHSARGPPPVPAGGGANTAREKAIAEHIAFRFEDVSGRHPRYVAQDEQDREGCDILSDDRVIEVKGLIEGEGPFTLQESQYKRAEQEGTRYHVYVVSNLRRGQEPKISIIQDPVNSGKLVFERPRQWRVLDWKMGVKLEVQVRGNVPEGALGGDN